MQLRSHGVTLALIVFGFAAFPACSSSAAGDRTDREALQTPDPRQGDQRSREVPAEPWFPAMIQPDPHQVTQVRAPVSGRIAALLVRTGDAVAAGQVLAELESAEADDLIGALLQAEASRTMAQAQLRQSESDVERLTELRLHEAATEREALEAQTQLIQARSALEQAMSNVAQRRARIAQLGLQEGRFGQRVRLRAPIAGKVMKIDVGPGQLIPDASQPLLTVADLSSVWLVAHVRDEQMGRLATGGCVEVRLVSYPHSPLKTRLKLVSDFVDPESRKLKAISVLNNANGRLKPNMYGEIRSIPCGRDHRQPS